MDENPLYMASHDGYLDVVRALMKGGADIEKATNDGETPLYIASAKDEDVVSAMIEGGADINKANNGCTPLHTASENGHVDVVSALVEGGADIDKAGEEYGWTPLHMSLTVRAMWRW
jgi:ankyrin repeat protein